MRGHESGLNARVIVDTETVCRCGSSHRVHGAPGRPLLASLFGKWAVHGGEQRVAPPVLGLSHPKSRLRWRLGHSLDRRIIFRGG